MIFLYILLGLLGFLLLLLCLIGSFKLSVRAAYCQTALLIVKIGPFSLQLIGGEKRKARKEKAPAQTSAKKAQKKKKKPKKVSQKASKAAEKPPVLNVVTAFRDLLVGLLRDFTRRVKIEELRLRVLVASEDAAKTALEYAAVCALVDPVRFIATQARRVEKDRVKVAVECDFLADKPEIDAEFCLSMRIWHLGVVGLRSTKPLLNALSLLKAYTAANTTDQEEQKAAG